MPINNNNGSSNQAPQEDGNNNNKPIKTKWLALKSIDNIQTFTPDTKTNIPTTSMRE